MRAFKFLSEGGRGIFSDFSWPLPWNGTPGSWVTAGLPLEPCVKGIHVCREEDLPYWIDDELWVIELRGELATHGRMIVAEEGRLVTKIDGWNREAATTFAETCALRARTAAVETLRSAGKNDDASSRVRTSAVTVHVTPEGTLVGAVYKPDAEIVPATLHDSVSAVAIAIALAVPLLARQFFPFA